MAECVSAGVRTYFEEHADGEPVVLLHGKFVGGDSWRTVGRRWRRTSGCSCRTVAVTVARLTWQVLTDVAPMSSWGAGGQVAVDHLAGLGDDWRAFSDRGRCLRH